jgi:hypothetical protein
MNEEVRWEYLGRDGFIWCYGVFGSFEGYRLL